ncbi:hypothetical protein ES703_10184 [subsurface metagenome]
MHEIHGKIGEEGLVLVRFDKVDQEVSQDIRSVRSFRKPHYFSIALKRRIPVTLPSGAGDIPETVSVKARLHR